MLNTSPDRGASLHPVEILKHTKRPITRAHAIVFPFRGNRAFFAERGRVCKISRFVIGVFRFSSPKGNGDSSRRRRRRKDSPFRRGGERVLREGRRSRGRAQPFSLETSVVHSRRVHRAKTIAMKKGYHVATVN